MSRSNHDKPFYVDVGTSVAAIRCASNHDVVCSIDHHGWKSSIELLEKDCDRMNREFDLSAKRILDSVYMKSDWSVAQALALANALANHGWERGANSDVASACIYALCRMLKEGGNPAALRNALKEIADICDGRANAANPSPSQDMFIIYNLAKAALAEPARNCDIYATEKSVEEGREECDHCSHQDHEARCVFCMVRWMLSTAKEGDKA